jgi:hypothetical protein
MQCRFFCRERGEEQGRDEENRGGDQVEEEKEEQRFETIVFGAEVRGEGERLEALSLFLALSFSKSCLLCVFLVVI